MIQSVARISVENWQNAQGSKNWNKEFAKNKMFTNLPDMKFELCGLSTLDWRFKLTISNIQIFKLLIA